MLLDSLERSKSLQFSLFDHTLAALLVRQLFAEQKSSRCEGLKGWSWLPFHRCTHEPREVVSSDRPRGGSPPQRNLSVVGDDNPGMRV